jgi:hypothetical protein
MNDTTITTREVTDREIAEALAGFEAGRWIPGQGATGLRLIGDREYWTRWYLHSSTGWTRETMLLALQRLANDIRGRRGFHVKKLDAKGRRLFRVALRAGVIH